MFLIELNKIKNEVHAKIPDKINKSLLKKYEYSVTKKDKNINTDKFKDSIIEDGEKKPIDFFANLKGNTN